MIWRPGGVEVEIEIARSLRGSWLTVIHPLRGATLRVWCAQGAEASRLELARAWVLQGVPPGVVLARALARWRDRVLVWERRGGVEVVEWRRVGAVWAEVSA